MYHTSVGHIILWWRSYILCLHFFGELYLDLLSPSITKMVMLCMYVRCSQRDSIGVESDRYLHPVRQHQRQRQIPHWADHTSSAAVSISVVAVVYTLHWILPVLFHLWFCSQWWCHNFCACHWVPAILVVSIAVTTCVIVYWGSHGDERCS